MQQVSKQKVSFVRSVVDAAGIKVVKVRTPGLRGRFGFARTIRHDGNVHPTLERSALTYTSEDAAYLAAHKHYNLRSA